MKIGFIVGKNEENYDDKFLKNNTPKKYLVDNELNSDVAIAMTVKLSYPDVTVDIILPNEISKTRLKRNDVNFILGYDCINAINSDPFIKKFSTLKSFTTNKP